MEQFYTNVNFVYPSEVLAPSMLKSVQMLLYNRNSGDIDDAYLAYNDFGTHATLTAVNVQASVVMGHLGSH